MKPKACSNSLDYHKITNMVEWGRIPFKLLIKILFMKIFSTTKKNFEEIKKMPKNDVTVKIFNFFHYISKD